MHAVRPRAAVAASLLAMLTGGVARAQDDVAGGEDDRPAVQKFYPPPVDGPALRLPESPTRLYLDGAYAASNDLSSLPYIKGSGKNFRFAAGGVWRWHRFSVEGELNFLNVTTLHVTDALNAGPPDPEEQTRPALGDLRVGATWTERLAGEALIAGVGYRTRLPTHTTQFTFKLPTDGSTVSYVFPYYFHLEPTVIVGGAIGRFTYTVNEGALIFVGPNGNFLGMEVIVPTIMFWDSHVAVSYAPWDFLGASVELGTDVQINHVDDPQFPINSLRSLWVAPALQGHIGDWRIDAIARLGHGRGSETFGVLEYVGTNSFTLRATVAFK
jgi:hypothetical protein